MAEHRPPLKRWGAFVPLTAVLIGAVGLMMIVLLATGFEEGAAVAALLMVILLIGGVIDFVVARRALRQNADDQRAMEADARDPVPAITVDEQAPLGDTNAVHDGLIPEDLPKDHPGRHEIERRHASAS
jgi:hypothetical protein